ncbi:MAG: hypothetical protein KAJ01_03240 [Candidatus Hydrogenedentes bacterium]|nr:hypothetical protein [Candidatus Hydrogenedentota bacterium]
MKKRYWCKVEYLIEAESRKQARTLAAELSEPQMEEWGAQRDKREKGGTPIVLMWRGSTPERTAEDV